MSKTKYNFFDNSFFTEYESVPEVKLLLPLFDNPIDISDWATGFSLDGKIPIVKDNLNSEENKTPEYKFIIDTPEEEYQYTTTNMSEKTNNTVKKDLSGNRKKALDYFMGKGLEYHLAAGLVGNLIRESNLDPTARNKYSGAIGLAQWLGSRLKRLFSKYGKNPTFELLLDFVWEELNSTHKKGLEKLRQSLNAKEAAINAFGWYEFSVGPEEAVKAMNKYGLNGRDAYNKGIKFAESLI